MWLVYQTDFKQRLIECEFHKANGFCTEGTEHIKPLIRSGSTILNQREAGQNEDRHVFGVIILLYVLFIWVSILYILCTTDM